MRALVRKELGRLLPLAAVAALVLAALYASAFDVKGALLAPPSGLQLVVLLLAVNLGALIGYAQIASERQAGTLSLLLQRDMAPGALIAAKCAAAWAVLVLVVHAPLVLFALWESAVSPLAPVLQVGRLGELLLLGLVCVPAHACGFFGGTLPLSARWRRVLVPFAAQGLVILVVLFLYLPIAGRWASTVLFLLGASVLSVWLLTAARVRLALLDDEERSEPARTLCSQVAFLVLALAAPGCLVLLMAQEIVLDHCTEKRASIAWHPEHGPVRTQQVDGEWRAYSPEGDVLPDLSIDPSWAYWAGSGSGWDALWFWRGDLAEQVMPNAPASYHRPEPCLAPQWNDLGSASIGMEADGGVELEAEPFLDEGAGSIVVLYTLERSKARAYPVAKTAAPPDTPSLQRIVRGDGRPFSPRSLGRTFGQELRVDDPADGTSWRLLLAETPPAFTRIFRSDTLAEPEEPTSEAGVSAVAEGDRLSCTVRVVESATGKVLMTHSYGPSDSVGRAARAFLFGSTLCLPPALLLGSHAFAGESSRWTVSLGGLLVGQGRRLWLVLASLGVGLLLAGAAQRSLRRRGAEAWRRRTWMLVVLALGPAGWLLFRALEPRASAAPAPRSARASVRILSQGAALG